MLMLASLSVLSTILLCQFRLVASSRGHEAPATGAALAVEAQEPTNLCVMLKSSCSQYPTASAVCSGGGHFELVKEHVPLPRLRGHKVLRQIQLVKEDASLPKLRRQNIPRQLQLVQTSPRPAAP